MPNRPAPSRSSRRGARLALTGTPVENRLGDLWSIFDFVNPGLLGTSKEFAQLRQTPGRTAPRLLRAAARTGAAVYSAAPEDRQDGDRGPAGQNRNQGVLPAQPPPGRTLPAGGEGVGRTTRGCRRDTAQGAGAVVPDALQADLQPSLAMAGRRRLGRRRQRQMGASARDCRGDRRQAGEDARLYPVPRGDRAAGRFPRLGFRTARPGAARTKPK